MTQRPIRGADLFCGSGGFSTALVRAVEQLFPGRELDLVAVNHWQVAIDTHQANHPGVRHFCADLEHLKPRDAVPGGVLDILLAAPSCTYHSRARGGRQVYDQQRMDPWHVVRWCTDLRVYRLLVENVPEFMDWGPCNAATGKPIKRRKGEYFRAWVAALKAIGMRVEHKVLTCANYGERPGQKPRTHAIKDPAPTIAATGHIQLAQPFIAPITHHDGSNRCRSVDEPLPTITTAHRGEQALASPALADGYYIDILYRMLHWSELARATSFEDEGKPYHFTGTTTEITKQIGNAVPIRTGAALCAAALAP